MRSKSASNSRASSVRPCELLGLQWKDVDFEGGLIRVEQNAIVIGGKMHLGAVKTKASRRAVTIPRDTVVELALHLERQQFEREHLDHPSADALRMRQRRLTPTLSYVSNDLVFANELGGVTNYHNLYRVLQTLITRAGVTRIGLHGMRHTHASILIQRGVKPTVVSDRLGHKDIAFTLKTYAHLFNEQRLEAAIDIQDFLGMQPVPVEQTPAEIFIEKRVLN
jgi:integrase